MSKKVIKPITRKPTSCAMCTELPVLYIHVKEKVNTLTKLYIPSSNLHFCGYEII